MNMLIIRKYKKCFLLGICLFSLFSCKGEQTDTMYEVSTDERHEKQYIIIEPETVLSIYQVEGTATDGGSFIGEVKIKGDVGAGYITRDSTSTQLYIEVRRSQEGGLIGTDVNGEVYQLTFKGDE